MTNILRVLVIGITVLLLSRGTVAAQDVPPCEIVGKAAGNTIYRCVDDETGNIIYVNQFGFMFVVGW
jgi:hypothetical protein